MFSALKLLRVAVLLTVLPIANHATVFAAEITLRVVPDQENALYQVGETALLNVSVTDGDKQIITGVIDFKADNFLETVSAKTGIKLAVNPVTIKLASDKPRFIRCYVSVTEIKPGLPVPNDFDAFWDKQRAELAQVKMASTLTRVAYSDPELECFDVQVTCVAPRPVSGYYAKQKAAAVKSSPAILWVHGAGVRSSSLGAAVTGARAGMLSMDINAHGIANGKPADFYKTQTSGPLKDYRFSGREDRDTIYFRHMYLRIVRAIDFLTAQSEWDGKNVIVIGHSQGGGQALVAGGIDDRVTVIASGVPAICDHGGRETGQINGWPKIVPYDANGVANAKALQASRYIDAVNFASRFQGKAIMSVGFVDRTCPPSSCYAAFNVLDVKPGDKTMLNEPLMGHAAPVHIKDAFFEFIKRSLK
jgi:cephalosporin-C deacetylase-like acetyl esterase